MKAQFSPTAILIFFMFVIASAWTHGAVTYIGDDASAGQGQLVTSGSSGPDTANGGSITYGFTSTAFANNTGAAVRLEIREVNFWAVNAGTLTPFVATYNGAGTGDGSNYTVVAVGDPIEGTAGRNNAEFDVGGATPVVTVDDGDSLVAGFHQSNGMVPWESGTGDYLIEDNVIPAVGGNLPDSATWSTLGRGYKFNVGVERASDPMPPSDIELSNSELLPGAPLGTTVGTFSSTDPNSTDNVFIYTLVSGAGGTDNALFSIAGPRLETASALGGVGTTYSIRIRSTDPGGLSYEESLTINIIAGQPPTTIELDAEVAAADTPPGGAIGTFTTIDPDSADQHTYTLVGGAGSSDNAMFSITGNRLRVAQVLPAGGATLSIRVRTTDLSDLSIEQVFSILVIDPSVRISEFMASNSSSLLDEDGDSSDWIEIFNEQAEEVNLGGWFLTDDIDDLTKWQFPSINLAGGGYLIVFASSKDRAGENDPELHTNFNLASSGEYLALVKPDGQTLTSFFAPTFPAQTTDVSYGVNADASVTGFFSPPSPGTANGTPAPDGVNVAAFSVERGFYEDAIQVALTPSIPGSTIRYTTNGSKPSTTSGTVYSAPIAISQTTALRAISYVPGGGGPDSPVITHTYFFVDDVINQSVMNRSITQNATWGPMMRDSLLEIPTVSLVKSGSVSTSESETSMEMIFPDGTKGFQIDCGVEHFGGHSLNSPKKNMRMSFKKIYGPSRLKYDFYGGDAATDFDQIILRTGSHDTWFWTHPSGHGGVFIRGRWAFDRQLEMGNVAPRGRWAHVYINGTYHGMHHLMERPNAAFMASYLGGEKEDYEALNAGSPIDGDKSTWNAMKGVLGDWEQLTTYMDVQNYADYMLLQFYGGNDWDWNTSQNWSSASRKAPNAAYKFFAWDSDVIIRTTLNANVINRGGPESMWGAVRNHPEFKLLLADRAQKVFFNDGMLTRDRVLAQLEELAAIIELPIVAETARWGGGSYTPSTWRNELNEVKNDLIQQRTGVVVAQMRSAGVFPSFDAPVFNQYGGAVPTNFQLTLSLPDNAAGAEIRYSLDGSDPVGDLIPPDSVETILFDQGIAAKALVPTVANGGSNLGDTWKGGSEPFDDASWISGTSGIGYDLGSDYDPLIGLDLQAEMQTKAGSAFARIAFTLTQEQVDAVDQLLLDMKAEDGFVAYLNGTEVASLQKPAGLDWDSLAAGSTSDSIALQFQEHDITAHRGNLVAGENILALHILNQTLGSSDLLCLPRLVGREFPDGGGPIGGLVYTGPITLTESTTVKARVKLAGQWSALEAPFFVVDAVAPAPGELIVSEINYNPAGPDQTEFIEIRNNSAKNLVLDGLQFVDGVSFTFAANTVLEAGEHIVVVGDEAPFFDRFSDRSSPWYHDSVRVAGKFSGSLDNGGENLTLHDASGSPLLDFSYDDSGRWPGRADEKGSSAELEDPSLAPTAQPALDEFLASGSNWRPSSEFHGSPGRAGSGRDNRVVFNEVLSHTDLPAVDRFELYNTTGATVDVSGWFISDDSTEYKKFEIPTLTTIDAGAFLTYDESDFNSGTNLVDFAISSAKGDDLYLVESDPFGNLVRFVDRAEFGASVNGESFGRWPDGSGDLYPMEQQTFSQLNTSNGNAVRVGSVVVAEIMYNPSGIDSGLEYIEIFNAGSVAEDLANWRLRGEADFDFAAESLSPGGVSVIVGFDPDTDVAARTAFLAAYPTATANQLRGPWSAGATNQLDSGGAPVRLQRPDALESPPGELPFYPALVEDTVNYDDESPWPTTPDGSGPALHRISTEIYGDAANNWQAATASPGSHSTVTISYESWAATHGLGVGAASLRLADFEFDRILNLLEFALDADPSSADREKLPVVAVQTVTVGPDTDDFLTLTYRKRRDAPQLIYTVQVSRDLVSWQAATNQVGATVDNGDGTDSITIRDNLPIDATAKRFIRLMVTEL